MRAKGLRFHASNLGIVHVGLDRKALAFDRILELFRDRSAEVGMLRVLHRRFFPRRHGSFVWKKSAKKTALLTPPREEKRKRFDFTKKPLAATSLRLICVPTTLF